MRKCLVRWGFLRGERALPLNNKGVAILMVLGAILVMSAVVVEFAYNSHVSYDLASSSRDRLKAYYLAQSALNLVKLELKIERNLRSQFAGVLQNLQGEGTLTSDPLCKQYPLSSGGLKAVASGDLPGLSSETVEKNKEGVEAAKEFLNFDGSFDAACDTEESRLNLNIFRNDPSPNPNVTALYDGQKQLLFSLLSQSEFESIFEGKPDEIRKVVNNIADWVDKDDRVNESPGVSGESEDAAYSGSEYSYKVKNGRYQTLGELHLVSGVTDAIYQKLEPQVTIFGDSKINLCQAPDLLVKAFVTRYASTTPGVAPVAANDLTQWEKILSAKTLACQKPSPRPQEVAAAIGAVIGATDVNTLAVQIATVNRFFRLKVSGHAGESTTSITEVIDTAGQGGKGWKTLYFQVE